MKIISKHEIEEMAKRGKRRNEFSLKRCERDIKSQHAVIENAKNKLADLEREYLVFSLALSKPLAKV